MQVRVVGHVVRHVVDPGADVGAVVEVEAAQQVLAALMVPAWFPTCRPGTNSRMSRGPEKRPVGQVELVDQAFGRRRRAADGVAHGRRPALVDGDCRCLPLPTHARRSEGSRTAGAGRTGRPKRGILAGALSTLGPADHLKGRQGERGLSIRRLGSRLLGAHGLRAGHGQNERRSEQPSQRRPQDRHTWRRAPEGDSRHNRSLPWENANGLQSRAASVL